MTELNRSVSLSTEINHILRPIKGKGIILNSEEILKIKRKALRPFDLIESQRGLESQYGKMLLSNIGLDSNSNLRVVKIGKRDKDITYLHKLDAMQKAVGNEYISELVNSNVELTYLLDCLQNSKGQLILKEIVKREIMKSIQTVQTYKKLSELFQGIRVIRNGNLLIFKVKTNLKIKQLLNEISCNCKIAGDTLYLKTYCGHMLNSEMLERQFELVKKYFKIKKEDDLLIVVDEDCSLEGLSEEQKTKVIKLSNLNKETYDLYISKLKEALAI